MAYSNEKRTNVISIEKNNRGEIFKVDSVEGSNGNSIDVRLYFTSDAGEVLPTKKGVRINSELAPQIVMAMIKAMDEEAKMELLDAVYEEYKDSLAEEMDFDDEEEDIED